MLTKFESKSARVKGLAFHPNRPWVCASLHNGIIQLWDYRVGTVIDRFEEHDGPVRGVDFHKTDPLIVSGGDDYKIKVWDYKLRRCLFTLLGHLDYIRTVQFHPDPAKFPWILSASDDQTLRLWDFYKRTCLSVLTGHNHYVMCAAFHPSEDLIVSASLDQTVRVWDTSGLRKKQMGEGAVDSMRGPPVSATTSAAMNVQAELFGTNDVVVKYVLEGHDRGVNWACFHPTLPLLASAADDRQVKLWRMSETKAWEVDTLRGHANNVSSCLFHPKHDLVVSNSEDRSIRVWDVSKRVGVQTFRREGDRFWILAAHSNQNLLAAGHDSGMIVFKLERERPAMCYNAPRSKLYYVRGRELFARDYTRGDGSGNDVPVASLRRVGQQAQTDGIGSAPRTLVYNAHNPSEGNVLVCSDVDGGCYELLTFNANNEGSGSVSDGKRGACLGPAVFLGRNRFAVLDRHQRQIIVKNLDNETTKRVQPPVPNVDALLDGGASGRVLLRADDRAVLFEVQSRRILGELSAPKIKSVVWSPDGNKVAIVCKYGVVIADRQLEQLCSVSDNVRIKSGAWDCSSSSDGTASNLFVYTTLNHVKYCLPSGDTGTIRTLESPIYAVRVVKDQLHCLDREARARIIAIDTTEARFKLALANKKYGRVMHMVKHSRLCGRAIVAYLQQKGFPEVALHFVREPKTRFKLALACGDIEAAMESAFALENQTQQNSELDGGSSSNDEGREIWSELGAEALRQGNYEVVEMSYQRTKDFDRLSFLYLITGESEKLRKMLKISNMRGDIMGRYHNALFLGDATERMSVLEASGNLPLAYMCAKLHGLAEDADRIKIAIETNEGEEKTQSVLEQTSLIETRNDRTGGRLLQPPTPIFRQQNWPTLAVEKSTLADMTAAEPEAEEVETQAALNAPVSDLANDWQDAAMDTADFGDDLAGAATEGDDLDFGDDDWGEDDDLDDLGDLGEDDDLAQVDDGLDTIADDSGFQLPPSGRPPAACWVANSSRAADHAAAGAMSSSLQLLNRQIAAADFSYLQQNMMGCYVGSMMSVPGMAGSGSMSFPLMRNDAGGHPGNTSLPRIFITTKNLIDGVKSGYRFFQGGKFNDSKAAFMKVLCQIPLVVTENPKEQAQIKQMVSVCREYITAIRIKGAMAEAGGNAVRATELSAYFTHCELLPAHLVLALRSAMGTAFKHKNYILAASCARRLLELPEMSSERNADLKNKATKVRQKSEQIARNEHELNYDETKNFEIDSKDLVPIYTGADSISCSYCECYFADNDMKNELCPTCGMSQVGIKTLGLVSG
jgi:coatomer protein complex subunit alpha (xenin)